MAYLNPPLTIIDNQSNLHAPIVSVPPAATWFDEDRQHFVALNGVPRKEEVGSAESIASGSVDYSVLAGAFYSGATTDDYEAISEVVQYQAFGMPNDRDHSSEKEEESSEPLSVFDAVKKAARGRNTLVTELSVAFPLPKELANVQTDVADDASFVGSNSKLISRRIPLLAKFSEHINGIRFLALQYTPTMVRIINVQNTKSTNTKEDKHWTIDLSRDLHPVSSPPHKLPSLREGREINTSIIGGGIIWCRGSNNTLNLIIITTTAVITYEMNLQTKILTKSRVYPHQTAISFWFEATSRVLVIGSYRSNHSSGVVMEMKTLFFNEGGDIETLPLFTVGSLRERDVVGVEAREAGEAEADIVSPTDLSLVCLHGDVFCVELGSLGSRKGIGFVKLDRKNMCVHVRQHETKLLLSESPQAELPFVGVVDNLLCIIIRESKSTMFLDVPALFSDDPRVFKEIIEVMPSSEESDAGMYDRSLSFLAPSFFLHTEGEGLLYEIKLDINALLRAIPSTACVVPFLLRRNGSRDKMLNYIMERLDLLIVKKDLSTVKTWLGVISEEYSKSETAMNCDRGATDELLLPISSLLELDRLSLVNEHIASSSCQHVLTQTEVLLFILLKHAKLALDQNDNDYLEFVCSMSINYLIEIERKSLQPCFSLQCLVIALLVKRRQVSELASYLYARETQCTQIRRRRQMNIPTPNMYVDLPGVAVVYAEILFKIAMSCSCESKQQRLISHATSILTGCNANTIAVKCLLMAGQLEDAIAVSSKKSRPPKDTTRSDDVIQAKDFFDATVAKAKLMQNVGDKCKLFYHLHSFLRQTFPDAFNMESRKIKIARRSSTGRRASFTGDGETVTIEQSNIAHECKFPDDLFGGSNTAFCLKLRTLFGYLNNFK